VVLRLRVSGKFDRPERFAAELLKRFGAAGGGLSM
jgi:hypothetical protein